MHWYDRVDWAAVIAAVIAFLNAIQHVLIKKTVTDNHAETLQAIQQKGS